MAVSLAVDSWTGSKGRMSVLADEEFMEAKEVSYDFPEEEDVDFGVRTDPQEIARARSWLAMLSDEMIVLHYRNRHNI